MKSNLRLKLIPCTEKYQLIETELLSNGLIEPVDLKHIILPSGIDFRKGVIIYGKAPVWLYAFLSHELHIAKWVATFDPRIGAVVVQSHGVDSPQKGDIIPSEEILPYLEKELVNVKKGLKSEEPSGNKVICIVGPANSGKSVLIRELRRSLNERLGEEFRRDYFIIRACPDGEGDWFGDLSPEEGKMFRVKKIFDDEFAPRIAEDIKRMRASKRVIIVDCGGKIDRKNQIILNECTHGIIVSANEEDTKQWIGALKASEVSLLAEVQSRVIEVSDHIGNNVFEVGKLFREESRVELPSHLLSLIAES